MKRILFITDIGSSWGGSEELWSKSALLLIKEGYKVDASLPWHGEIHEKVHHLIREGINIKFRKSYLRTICNKAYKYTQNYVFKLVEDETVKHIKKSRPDLIVFSQSHVFGAWEYMNFAYKKNIKYCLVTQLNSELSWATDNNYKQIRKAFLGAETSFFVSKGNLDLLEIQLAFKLPNAKIISNPFNMASVIDLPWPNGSKLNFAYVGRLDFTHKGIDILLRSFATDKWKERDFALNIYGSGNLELAKALVSHLNLLKKVFFHGHVDNIHEIWKKNHILTLASRYEGMPLVLIEAMFCKRSAIVTDVAGHGELIEDGVNGFVVPAAHVKLFTNKLEEVWENRDEIEKYGIAAFNKIIKKINSLPEKIFSNHIRNIL